MLFLGQIEALSESAGIAPDKWLALIDSDELLAHTPPRKGVNPFTRKPCEYNAPASTAVVRAGGRDIGSIGWAMDGSQLLIVEAEEEAVEVVASVAEDVAKALGGRFSREPARGRKNGGDGICRDDSRNAGREGTRRHEGYEAETQGREGNRR